MAFCGACCAGGADAEVVTVEPKAVAPAEEAPSIGKDAAIQEALQSPRLPQAIEEPSAPAREPEAKKQETGDSKDRKADKQPSRETEGGFYDVEIEIADQKLGIDINYCDGVSLLVTKLSEGPIMAYNRRNPTAQILVCDRFVAINGVKDDVKEILKATKAEKVMKATLKRANERTVYLSGDASNMGLELQDNDLVSLVVKAEPAAGTLAAEHNALEPNFAIRKGDSIVAVNGAHGSPTELRAKLQAGNSWELTLRRIDRQRPKP